MSLVYIVEEQTNPSTDYYILPALNASRLDSERYDFNHTPSPNKLNGATIIFIRYIPNRWKKLIESNKSIIRKIIFFMDDDVLDLDATETMPWHYRLKLFRLSATRSWWLKKNNVKLWVSTPYLIKKYAEWNPTLILPSSIPSIESCRVFYHGSLTHKAEIRWLRPIIEEVVKKNERISFEIVGEKDTFKLYKGLPRVTTIHPMKWPAYQTFTSGCKGHIGLAPLLNIPFNQARSYNKFLDFTRCDAVGIYTENTECARVVEHQLSGLIVPMDPQVWIDHILKLASNQKERLRMLGHARQQITTLDSLAREGYSQIDL